MKLFKHIALTLFLVTGIFCAVLYTSCQKDVCKGVTCLNNTNCSGGSCICPPGIGGSNCQTIYRNLYAFSYKGVVTASSVNDTNHVIVDSNCVNNTLVFVAGNDTMNYNNMQLTWNDSTGKQVLNMQITLSNNSPNGSDFTVDSATSDTFTYSGTGNVNTVSASMSLTRSHPNGPSQVVFLFNNFNQQ